MRLKFDLIFHELNSKKSELIFEDEKVEIKTVPLHHRIYTNGFFFKEKEKPRKLDMNAINEVQEIEICDYNNLKAGKDFVTNSNETIQNSLLTLDPEASLSYAFCSDTSYKPDIIEIIGEANLLYHEATFLSDKEDLAKKTRHSTARQAALIAKKANVEKLIIGHYSSRYKDISLFKKEAEEIFNTVILAEAGKVISIK